MSPVAVLSQLKPVGNDGRFSFLLHAIFTHSTYWVTRHAPAFPFILCPVPFKTCQILPPTKKVKYAGIKDWEIDRDANLLNQSADDWWKIALSILLQYSVYIRYLGISKKSATNHLSISSTFLSIARRETEIYIWKLSGEMHSTCFYWCISFSSAFFPTKRILKAPF
jgi:hypothetical protein